MSRIKHFEGSCDPPEAGQNFVFAMLHNSQTFGWCKIPIKCFPKGTEFSGNDKIAVRSCPRSIKARILK